MVNKDEYSAWVAGYVIRQFTSPKAVIHHSISRVQCRATASPTRYRYTKPSH